MTAPADNRRTEMRNAWYAFVDTLIPMRPALHAYCRRLTGNVWDGEDLVQDTVLRAYAHWGVTYPPITDPKNYLLRTATNLWIDRIRRRAREDEHARQSANEPAPPVADPDQALHLRDATARLMQRLAPQERAAIVLKEAFDMPIEDIAGLLSTTPGAVKAALHRARDRLAPDATPPARQAPPPAVIDAFIDRFNARDPQGMLALMLETATAENVGNSSHAGFDSDDGLPNFVDKVVNGHKEWPEWAQVDSSRLQPVVFEGEAVILVLVMRKGRERLMTAFRIDAEGDRIARIRSYGFCPDTIRAIGEALGLPVFTGLYHAPV